MSRRRQKSERESILVQENAKVDFSSSHDTMTVSIVAIMSRTLVERTLVETIVERTLVTVVERTLVETLCLNACT